MKINPEVDAFLKEKGHPMTELINEVRYAILEVDERIEETIKWSSPTFIYKGNIASFFLNAKKIASLMFHKGASINDPSGLLKGDGKEGRVARFESIEDLEAKKGDLASVIKEWINMQDED
ncbi:MAG: DUF1801 domain-containing protein [Cyclobacteriaceae bacterium]